MASDNPSAVLIATDSFVCDINGERYTVHAGETRIAASHVLASHHSNRFRPIEQGLSYQDETATANPGEQRARPTKRSEQTATTAAK